MNSKERKEIAQATLAISETGILPNGYDFSSAQRAAELGTILYRPHDLQAVLLDVSASTANCRIVVTDETTQRATYRLAIEDGIKDVVLLNFASARNPGGGFLNGARAQEEDICRCSGLYLCQLTQDDYYQMNRQQNSMLYTDNLIYSPEVPFFRVNGDECLDVPYFASVITAPAPNAGQYLRRNKHGESEVERVLLERAGYVLAIAKAQGHKNLVLGAWGCGVFQNTPETVAKVFAHWLNDAQFADAFEEVTFAIYSGRQTYILNAFEQEFKG